MEIPTYIITEIRSTFVDALGNRKYRVMVQAPQMEVEIEANSLEACCTAMVREYFLRHTREPLEPAEILALRYKDAQLEYLVRWKTHTQFLADWTTDQVLRGSARGRQLISKYFEAIDKARQVEKQKFDVGLQVALEQDGSSSGKPFTSSLLAGTVARLSSTVQKKNMASNNQSVSMRYLTKRELSVSFAHGADGTRTENTLYVYCKCGSRFEHPNLFMEHLKLMRNGNKKLVKTPLDNLPSSYERPVEGVFKCKFCTKNFTRHHNLKLHVQNAHGIFYAWGKYGCQKCGRTFQTLCERVNHSKSHRQ